LKPAKKALFVFVLLMLMLNGLTSFAQETADDQKPKNLTELKKSIQKVLKDTKTPGAVVVMISGDETTLLEGFGNADNVDLKI
jgi:hypothetical protein